jgi:hypothetical protein
MLVATNPDSRPIVITHENANNYWTKARINGSLSIGRHGKRRKKLDVHRNDVRISRRNDRLALIVSCTGTPKILEEGLTAVRMKDPNAFSVLKIKEVAYG